MQPDEPSSAPGQIVSLDDALTYLVQELEQHWSSSGAAGQWGRFQLLRELGRGGNGIVFLAFDPAPGRQIALKVPRWPAPDRETHERFLQEAKAAGQIDHPHVLPIYECGQVGPVWYLAMPYCPGPTLAGWIKAQTKPVDPRQAAQLLLTLAEAMQAVHAGGIWHRDLKPSNVLLFPTVTAGSTAEASAGPDGGATGLLSDFVPRIADFGLAKLHEADRTATRTGAALGTPAYMAPEQAEGRLKDVGPATDVYALGVILYELLAGHPPFHGVADLQMFQRVVSEEPSSLRSVRREVPRDLETICLKCLAKQPGRRYPSPGELADDLRRFMEGRPITARRAGRLERTIKSLRRRPLVSGMAALIIAAFAAVLALALREPAVVISNAGEDPDTRDRLAKMEALHWSARNVVYSQTIRKAWKLCQDSEFHQLGVFLRSELPEPGERDVRGFEWHYLWRLAQRDLLVLRGHTAPLSLVAFSADGRFGATASELDEKIILWELPQGRKIAEYPLGLPRIFLLALSADGDRLVAAFQRTGDDESVVIKVWDIAAGMVLAERSFPWRASVTVSLDGRQAAGIFDPLPAFTRAELQIVDIETGGRRTLIKTDKVDLHNPSFSPDGKLIAVGHHSLRQTQAHLIDAASGALVAKLEIANGPIDFIFNPAFSADGRQLSIGSNLGHGAIWNWSADKVVRFREEGTIIRSALDPSSSVLALKLKPALAGANRIRLLDARTGNLLRDITPADFEVYDFGLSADGQMIALCSTDNLLHLQQLNHKPAEKWLPPPAPRGEAWAVAFSPKGRTLAVGYDNEDGQDAESLKLWDVKQTNSRVLAGHQGAVMAVAYSPDGRTLATASYDGKVGLWNVADGKHPLWLEGHTKPVRAVAFSPDGRLVASAGSDQLIMLWNVAQRKLIAGWTAHERDVRALGFSPDGRQVASAGNDSRAAVWDVHTHQRLFTLADDGNVSCLAYAPIGTILATGNERFDVKLWDPATGKLTKTLKGHTGSLRALAFSPNGQTLATGGEDKAVRLWNVVTGDELFALPTEHFVNGLAFDRDGKTLAAALHDGRVTIWSAE